MAKLERKTQKIFASVANSNEIAAFGTMKTGNPTYTTDLDILQNANYTEGWDEGILEDKAPYLEEMNGVQYGITRQLAYLFQEGLPEYDANTNYAKGSWIKYNGFIYESLIDDNLGHQVTDINYWNRANLSYGGLPIGTIYSSLASDNFVPYGSVPCDGSEYSGITFKELFDNYLVAGLLTTCSYDEYAQSLSTYGNCAKFAIDTVNQTFKVPTIKNKMYQGLNNQIPVVGNGMTLGFTDGKDNYYSISTTGNTENYGILKKDNYGQMLPSQSTTAWSTGHIGVNDRVGITTDTTKSGMVANLGNAEQILNIKYFVVISTGDLNKAEVDWSEYIRNIQNKANKNFDNIEPTDEAKANIINWMMPDYTAGISVPHGTNFTCPKDGWVLINDIRTNNGYTKIIINGSSYNFADSGGNYHNTDFAIIPVSKNDVINFTGIVSIFYPAKGEV